VANPIYLRFVAYLPTRYFLCHAGVPNFSFREPDGFRRFADERARVVFRRERDRLPPERPPERVPGNSAALEAGVIWANPLCPPGGTITLPAIS
jgi:hypothetical protein